MAITAHTSRDDTKGTVKRYLVLAHHEGNHEPVLETASQLMAAGPCEFHVLVPATPPERGSWLVDEEEARDLARWRLSMALMDFTSIGATASGEISSPELHDAVLDALSRGSFDGLIISTLPDGLLERLHLDLVHRLEREVDLPVIHLVARHAVPA
jgi:hypothetical protein